MIYMISLCDGEFNIVGRTHNHNYDHSIPVVHECARKGNINKARYLLKENKESKDIYIPIGLTELDTLDEFLEIVNLRYNPPVESHINIIGLANNAL